MATSRKSTTAKAKRTTPRAAAAKPAKPQTPADKPAKDVGGRPPLHTPQLAEAVCQSLMNGKSLRTICAEPGMPSVDTVMRWLHGDVGGFCEQYARAREIQAELWGEDTIAIADEDRAAMEVIEWETNEAGGFKVPVTVAFDKTAIARNKLRVETRFRYAAQMAPKRFGKIAGIDPENTKAGVVLFVKDMTGRKD